MALSETAVDDPLTLNRVMAQAQPSQSHVGRMMDTGRSHTHLIANSAPKTHSVTRMERGRLLQLQREYQAAWDVTSERKLLLPELRTMAPSFTKTTDEGRAYLGGTKIGGAGYNTIVGMIPSVYSVKRIADDDELISSFRPYRIDAVRAARLAEATNESAPHPDDTRHLEPTLFALASNRLIDSEAIPGDVVREHWETACIFAATTLQEDRNSATLPLATGIAEAVCPTSTKSPQRTLPTGTSSFLVTERFKSPKKMPGVRQPVIGHYHQRYSQVEPRVVGGYMSPRESAAPQKRSSQEALATDIECSADTGVSPTANPRMLESVKDFACLTATCRTPLAATTTHSLRSPCSGSASVLRPSHMFISKTRRSSLRAKCSAANDVEYFPYPDVRSTVKRSRCPVKFDAVLTERRRDDVVSTAVVGMYDIGGDISRCPHRVVCMDRESGRDTHWTNKPPTIYSSPDAVCVDNAIKAVKPRMRVVHLAPQVPDDHAAEHHKEVPDTTVSIERDLNFPVGLFDTCRARRVLKFDKMVGRSASAPMVSHESPEYVERMLVTKRMPCHVIHPTAPGHAPLHRPNPTEIGNIPSLTLVKPRTDRTTEFVKGASVEGLPLLTRDLWYDTSKRKLVEPRVKGDPRIETHVSRDKRAKVFSTAGCGANAVYNVDIPYRCKSVPFFEKQTTKETQFCGHRMQSERWQRKNPKAPGPGHYTVSYRLVE